MKSSNRALAAQHLLVSFFAAAGCQPNVDTADEGVPTVEEFFESRDELSCNLALECGQLMTRDQCNSGSSLSECSDYNASAAEACIEAMEDALEAVEADANACSDTGVSEACADVIIWDDSADGCGTTAGRPLFVDGKQLVPPVTRSRPPGNHARAIAAEHWLACAQMEAASVPAFTRLAQELASVGAPATMIEAARDAAADEVRHTQMCLDAARKLVHADFGVGPLPDIPARADVDVEQLALEALLEGCIAEGSAAAWASIASNRAQPEFAKTLRDIAADELRHAALSWRVIGWALRRRPALGPRLLAALGTWEHEDANAPVTSRRRGLAAMGVLSVAAERTAARELVSVVVRPTLQALCRRNVCASVRA